MTIADEALTAIDDETFARANYKYTVLMNERITRLRSSFKRTSLESADMWSIARMAVCEALYTYDGRGKELRWVRMRIDNRLIDAIRKYHVLNRLEMESAIRFDHGQSWDERDREKGRECNKRYYISLDAIAYNESDYDGDQRATTYHDIIPDKAPSPEKNVIDKMEKERLDRIARKMLTRMQYDHLLMYYRDGMTQTEIGRRKGLTCNDTVHACSRASQIIKEAIQKIRRCAVAADSNNTHAQ